MAIKQTKRSCYVGLCWLAMACGSGSFVVCCAFHTRAFGAQSKAIGYRIPMVTREKLDSESDCDCDCKCNCNIGVGVGSTTGARKCCPMLLYGYATAALAASLAGGRVASLAGSLQTISEKLRRHQSARSSSSSGPIEATFSSDTNRTRNIQ